MSKTKQRLEELEDLSRKNGHHAPIYMMNGDKYLGAWKNNFKHGDGTYFYSKTGHMYQGEWKYDKRNGFGVWLITF
jgi:hypothetical protein